METIRMANCGSDTGITTRIHGRVRLNRFSAHQPAADNRLAADYSVPAVHLPVRRKVLNPTSEEE